MPGLAEEAIVGQDRRDPGPGENARGVGPVGLGVMTQGIEPLDPGPRAALPDVEPFVSPHPGPLDPRLRIRRVKTLPFVSPILDP